MYCIEPGRRVPCELGKLRCRGSCHVVYGISSVNKGLRRGINCLVRYLGTLSSKYGYLTLVIIVGFDSAVLSGLKRVSSEIAAMVKLLHWEVGTYLVCIVDI